MRWLVWWFRSAFCNHDWLRHEADHCGRDGKVHTVSVSATCKKCGWHRAYRKFL